MEIPKEGTQCYRVLQFMKTHGDITQGDCIRMHPPILRLSARIKDLRDRYHILILPNREAWYDDDGREVSHWTAYHIATQEELEEGNADKQQSKRKEIRADGIPAF